MKKTKLITGVLAMFFASFSFAGTLSSEDQSSSIRDQLINKVSTPYLAKHHIEKGAVVVTFRINEEGELVLDNVRGSHEYLSEFVRIELEGTRFDLNQVDIKTSYQVIISFKLS